jgi:Calpain family cysteine protease
MTFRQALQRFTRVNRGRPARRPKTSQRRFELEALPDRTLLSVIFSSVNHNITVTDSLSVNTINVELATSGNAVTVTEDPGTSSFSSATEPPSSLSGGIQINTSADTDTVNVENNDFVPTSVTEGTGTDIVNISPTAQNLNNIQGYVAVNGGSSGNDTLNVNDQGGPGSTYTMASAPPYWYVYRPGAAYIFYNAINVVTVNGSDSTSTYNVQATEPNGTTDIIAAGTGNAPATVNVGQNHSVSAIQGTLSLSNPGNLNAIYVDDSGDTIHRYIGLWTGGTNSNLGQIVGLAPGTINYMYADTYSVTVQGGTAGNTWYVEATGANGLANGVITNLVDGGAAGNRTPGGTGTFYVGWNNSVSYINGTLDITDPTSFSNIYVQDSADINPHAVITLSTLSPNPTAWNRPVPFGSITGLAPAPINYAYDDTSSVTIQGGDSAPSGNTWYVYATGFNYGPTGVVTTTIDTGGPDHVYVGNDSNDVSSIQGTLYIEDSKSSSANTISINADTAAGTAALSSSSNWGCITRLAPAAIYYEYSTANRPVNISTFAGPSDALLGPVTWRVTANAMASVSVPVVNDNTYPINEVPTQPTLNAGYGLTYSPPSNTIPLFNNGEPVYSDVRQGAVLGDCWLLASLAEVAVQDQRDITDMFTYDGTIWDSGRNVGLYTVRLYSTSGAPEEFLVDTELPNGGVYYDDQVTTSLSPSTNALWVALAEKAYAVANGAGYVTTFDLGSDSYDALNSGFPSWALQAITGQTATDFNPIKASTMATDWTAGNFIVLTTGSPPSPNIVGDHCYAVVGYSPSLYPSQPYEEFNPWGTTSLNATPSTPASFYGSSTIWGLFWESPSFLSMNFDGFSLGTAASHGNDVDGPVDALTGSTTGDGGSGGTGTISLTRHSPGDLADAETAAARSGDRPTAGDARPAQETATSVDLWLASYTGDGYDLTTSGFRARRNGVW